MMMYDTERQEYLEHYGVKGMRWGVRSTRRLQKRLDRTKRVRDGSATTGDKLKTAYVQGVYTQKGAARVLKRGAKYQAKIVEGDKKVREMLLLAGGIRIRDLNYE